ncbi:MAG: beta-ketoacyl-[acyl-carrier-protein] synthase family protein [Hyphomicrobiales bacterium]|nr:beta-ketoacyl-[acyl-carrier-protein] synthase family protein [Hyphomicrobiales bacterium]
MSSKRIVITGLGGLCGLGNNPGEIWDAMKNGVNGVTALRQESLRDLKVGSAGQITEIPDIGLESKDTITMDRFALLCVVAARQAFDQAGLQASDASASRMGAVIGTAICGCEAVEDGYQMLLVKGKKRTSVFTVPRIMPGAPAAQVSMVLGLRGPVFGVSSACSSANHAFISALDQLRCGRADVMVAGGTEAPLTYGSLRAWESLRVLSKDLCRPFSANRNGLVLGEGAGVAVLETLEHASARGANILCELAGGGLSADAGDIVSPTLEGPVAAIRACLQDAGLNPGQIDYINAHGTATKANDKTETEAIKTVFGSRATNVAVSSTKSMHAHCLGASAALEVIACVNAIREGVVPPTINYDEADPECNLDYTPNKAIERRVDTTISNSFAFGGTNAVIAMKRFVA